ncbi:MAG: hypothetical protein ACKVI3_08350 [Verrucomicrobiia bacterium]
MRPLLKSHGLKASLRCVELFYDMTPVVMPWYLLPVTWNLRASVLLLRETH